MATDSIFDRRPSTPTILTCVTMMNSSSQASGMGSTYSPPTTVSVFLSKKKKRNASAAITSPSSDVVGLPSNNSKACPLALAFIF